MTNASHYSVQKSAILMRSGGTEAFKTHYKSCSSLQFTVLWDNYLVFHEDPHKIEASGLCAKNMNGDGKLITGIYFILLHKENTTSISCSKPLICRCWRRQWYFEKSLPRRKKPLPALLGQKRVPAWNTSYKASLKLGKWSKNTVIKPG